MSGSLANPFRSLRHRNSRIWAAGALVSNIGTWVQQTAQDWLVFTELTQHDASTVGIVMGLQFACRRRGIRLRGRPGRPLRNGPENHPQRSAAGRGLTPQCPRRNDRLRSQ
ncbi:hypothetical protein [Rhizobium sp. CG5]|uniref:hypothetical protein n=1 Tax=Rhizobium sp. CG5 TaxID=2726076 RepID=UPI00331A3C8E